MFFQSKRCCAFKNRDQCDLLGYRRVSYYRKGKPRHADAERSERCEYRSAMTSHLLQLMTQNQKSDLSLPVNKPVETNAAETVDSLVEATAEEDVVILESSAHKPNRTKGEDAVIKNKDVRILESPPEETGKKRDVQDTGEEVVVPPKKRRNQGTAKPFTEEEKERLLAAVANIQPTIHGTWESVKEYFDENAPSDLPSDTPTRSCISLRNRFSRLATSMFLDTLAGKPVSINLTGTPLGAENLASESKPVDNDAVGDKSVCNGPVSEEPVGNESCGSYPRRVSTDRPLEEHTGTEDTNFESTLSDGTKNSKPPEAAEAPMGDDTIMDQEAERLSDAMITFFERFSADDDMIMGNECRDAFLSRLDNVERNMAIINSKVELILSSVQSRGALERDNRWIL